MGRRKKWESGEWGEEGGGDGKPEMKQSGIRESGFENLFTRVGSEILYLQNMILLHFFYSSRKSRKIYEPQIHITTSFL